MGLGGFAGEGQEARVWRLAANGAAAPQALRLTEAVLANRQGPTRGASSALAPHTPPLPDCPHLLPMGPPVDVGPRAIASILPLLSGGSFAQRLAGIGPLPAADCLKVAVSMRDALAALHGVGLVHLDVSPANILLTSVGLPVLGDTAGVVVADGQIARRGTPPYTVPGVDASPSTDWIALARVLTELASGSPLTQLSHLPKSVQPAVSALFTGCDPAAALPDSSDAVASGNGADPSHDRLLDVYPSGYTVPPHQRATMNFADGQASATDSGSSQAWRPKRRLVVSLLGAISLVTVFCGVALTAKPDPTAGCLKPPSADHIEPGFVAVDADTGGRCPTIVLWSQGSGVLVVPTSEGPQRFVLGRPGDVLSFGDWDCNGTVTPALTRNEQLMVFASWPQDAPVQAVLSAAEPTLC